MSADALVLSTGATLVVLGLWDQFWTILGQGGGPLTRRLASGIWWSGRRIYASIPRSRILSVTGVGTIVGVVSTWVLIQWAGWSLVFIGLPEGIVGPDGERASVVERVYFAGYTLSTLGLGDVRPTSPAARLLTSTASFNGLIQISFAVGYLVPLIVAATDKRRVSILVSYLGESSEDVLLNAWDGRSLRSLQPIFDALTRELALLEQRHLTYPVLPYLHSRRRTEAIGPALAVLDETLTLLTCAVDDDRLEGASVAPGTVHAHRRAISTLMETLATASDQDDDAVPPPPTLARLREAGVPVVSEARFHERIDTLADRRTCLRRLVRMDGWDWDAVRTGDAGDDAKRASLTHTTEI